MAGKKKSHLELSAERPDWLKVRLHDQGTVDEVTGMMRELRLTTVCEEARCPNLFECWADKTATFMLMGEICTRHCGFCSVGKGRPGALDPNEPENVAEAAERLDLDHVVITSVDRDDLPDYGAGHFARTLEAVRRRNPSCKIEVLVPDFAGDPEALEVVFEARPEVFNHNVETVPRLYRRARYGSDLQRSLDVLRRAGEARPDRIQRTKSGLMVGLGESMDEVVELLGMLRFVDVDVVTIGQYLQPTRGQLPIEKYYTPEEFAELRSKALSMGFAHVESGPFVRSSYHAKKHVDEESGAAIG
ncbi:MAG TPA: lipoyl synthase [Candidatus Krumholzibacteria bacterium]|nr:lipoyl synthase [Candidatus Krumholzibacteria bacterium]